MLKDKLVVDLNEDGSRALAEIMKATGLKRSQVIHAVLKEWEMRVSVARATGNQGREVLAQMARQGSVMSEPERCDLERAAQKASAVGASGLAEFARQLTDSPEVCLTNGDREYVDSTFPVLGASGGASPEVEEQAKPTTQLMTAVRAMDEFIDGAEAEAEQAVREARKNRKAARSGRKAALAESVKEALPKPILSDDDRRNKPQTSARANAAKFQSFPKPGKGK